MKHHIPTSDLAKPIFYLFLAGCLLSLPIETVDAHGVSLFAWVEGDTVYVESKFSGGKRVKVGKIIVTDPQGTELVKGTTNAEGEFSFKVPKKVDLKIVLLAGTAHRAEWTVSAAEFEMPAGRKKPTPEKSPGIKEIIIGIGCILSLAGVAAYIRNRKKKNLDHQSTKS
jgi:nickel transport protein